MFRPVSLFVGLRYTRSRRRNHFISFISGFSSLGIALGVIALITVLSVMNGFHKEIRDRILGMASDGDIQALSGRLYDWKAAMREARRNKQVIGVAPYIQAEAMLVNGRRVSGALIRGIEPALEPQVVDVGKHMLSGTLNNLQPGQYGIILGSELAAELGVGMGDKVTLVVPELDVSILGSMPRLKRFTVVGIFEVGMHQYDSGVAMINMHDAATLLRMGDSVTGVRIRIPDVWHAPAVSMQLANQMAGRFRVLNWTDYHRNFFAALRMEKRMMGLLLFLIVVIAAFNIITTLVMMVVDKRSDIAILKTFGATPGMIMRIFVVQGATLGAFGTLAGTFFGVLLAANIDKVSRAIEKTFGFHFLNPNVYYISELPTDVHVHDVLLVAGGSFLLSLLMTLYPAWRAYRTEAAEALRYE